MLWNDRVFVGTKKNIKINLIHIYANFDYIKIIIIIIYYIIYSIILN